MAWLTPFLITVQVLSAIALIVLVLLQHGKGADMGAAFGSGASGSLFGATGSANFLSRSTAVAATLFFSATLGLAFTASGVRHPRTETQGVVPVTQDAAKKEEAGKDAGTQAPKDVPTPSNTTAPPAPASPATPAPPAAPAKSADVPN